MREHSGSALSAPLTPSPANAAGTCSAGIDRLMVSLRERSVMRSSAQLGAARRSSTQLDAAQCSSTQLNAAQRSSMQL